MAWGKEDGKEEMSLFWPSGSFRSPFKALQIVLQLEPFGFLDVFASFWRSKRSELYELLLRPIPKPKTRASLVSFGPLKQAKQTKNDQILVNFMYNSVITCWFLVSEFLSLPETGQFRIVWITWKNLSFAGPYPLYQSYYYTLVKWCS